MTQSIPKPKSQRKYGLIIKLASHKDKLKTQQNQKISNHNYRFPQINDKLNYLQQNNTQLLKLKNIFQAPTFHYQQVDPQILSQLKNYEIVGLKQVQSYKNKASNKRKNGMMKRMDSLLTLSQFSTTIKQQLPYKIVKKDDLYKLKRKNQNKLNQNNNIDENQFTYRNIQMKQTINQSLQKFKQYAKIWQDKKSKRTQFPSVLEHVNKYRSKFQLLQSNTLNQKKSFIQANIWINSLKTDKNVKNFYNDKYVQRILHTDQGLMLKGKEKLQKEMEWVNEKNQSGFVFAMVHTQKDKLINHDKSIVNDMKKISDYERNQLQTSSNSYQTDLKRIKTRLINKSKISEFVKNTLNNSQSSQLQFSHSKNYKQNTTIISQNTTNFTEINNRIQLDNINNKSLLNQFKSKYYR